MSQGFSRAENIWEWNTCGGGRSRKYVGKVFHEHKFHGGRFLVGIVLHIDEFFTARIDMGHRCLHYNNGIYR